MLTKTGSSEGCGREQDNHLEHHRQYKFCPPPNIGQEIAQLTDEEKLQLLTTMQMKAAQLRTMVRNGGPRQALQNTRNCIVLLEAECMLFKD
jgi:hypothetical protein